MTRIEWLNKKHKELDSQVAMLEAEREHNRSPEHKALLVDLKKRKLALKTEMQDLALLDADQI